MVSRSWLLLLLGWGSWCSLLRLFLYFLLRTIQEDEIGKLLYPNTLVNLIPKHLCNTISYIR